MTAIARTDTDVIGALRREAEELRAQLDKALGRHGDLENKLGRAGARIIELERVCAELNTERTGLQARVLGIAEEAERDQEIPEKRGSAFWMAAWRTARRELGEKSIELVKQEQELARRSQWLKEYGEQLAHLQYRCTLLQAIADSVRACDPTDAISTVKVHYNDPDAGPRTGWLFDAIDFATKGPTP